ncbi:UBX domain-containing protein [Ditylenchus destructor]|uniref:UBX domain-containing protein n=1 Tax=Ditylenchus destructor TaxID=166010 RepID=A0AAD4MFU9_9BILA|nr:UBX domain-containing protein [Ditylenchus destructor]
MDQMELTDDQVNMLNQYKEITNECDDDMARATLASLDWNLQKAIEACDSMSGSNTNAQPAAIEDTNGLEMMGAFGPRLHRPQFERMDADNDDLIPLETHSFPRLNPNVKFDEGDSSSVNNDEDLDKEPGNSLVDKADKLGLEGFNNGMSSRKIVSSREDSGSGSTCSLSNQGASQPSTSQAVEVSILEPSVSTQAKASRKVKKHCKGMTGEGEETLYISSDSDENDIEMEDSVVYISDDDAKQEGPANASYTDQIPLIPTDFTSIGEAVQNFTSVFEARYGHNYPTFYHGGLQSAVTEAFEAPGRPIMERRPLAIYLHNDTSVASHIFAQNVLCSEQVSSLLKCQFVLWAWDMTQKENREKLYQWLSGGSMRDVCENLKTINRNKYPLLIILVKDRGTIYPSSVVKGHDSAESTLEKLMMGLDTYMRIKNKDAEEEQKKLEREQIRQEQIDEYEKSLAADRAKKEEQEKQRQLEMQEELKKQRAEQAKQDRQIQLASIMPDEPSETETNVIAIRVRLPTGEQKMRRFRMDEALRWLVTYVESMGYEMDEYRIWTSDVPKKDVSTLDAAKTFTELGWSRREQVTVDEK